MKKKIFKELRYGSVGYTENTPVTNENENTDSLVDKTVNNKSKNKKRGKNANNK